VPNLHDSRGVLIGEGAEEDRVHHGENGGVGTDAQSEEEDGGYAEAWIAKEDAKAKAKVLEEVTHKEVLLAADERKAGGDMSCMETGETGKCSM
jgi:hypothetical protein